VVVVNGAEGEPLSVKDRMLLETVPHLVLDGAICCARLLGADEIVIAIDESFSEAIQTTARALRERPEFGRRSSPPRVVPVPSGYITGQESAIVNFINSGRAKPTSAVPRITERGVARRPTLMSNAETLAHVALIARHGAKWFRQLGPSEQPGSVLVTLSGAVRHPGVYEAESGSRLGSLLDGAGGLTETVRAYLFGGYAGGWVDVRAAASLRISQKSLGAFHLSLGAGIVAAFPRSACPVAEVTRVAAWMADQKAEQCGPCVNGLNAIAGALADVSEGVGGPSALRDIRHWAGLVVGRGACAHPDGAARFVTSALNVFAGEFEDHALHGPCDACQHRPVLITPRLAGAGR
jgi:NADH:ubiquinone oxidoreductase subunit F (NADH-binding)